MSGQAYARFVRALLLVIAVLNVLACGGSYTDGPVTHGYYMIPGLLPDGIQPQLLAVDRNNPEQLLFTAEYGNDNITGWRITLLEDGFYHISSSRVQDEPLVLGLVNDGVYDRLAMTEPSDFSGQKWQITHSENRSCRFSTELLGPGIALTVSNDTQPAQLTMMPVSNLPGQNWLLDSFGGGGIVPPPEALAACDNDVSSSTYDGVSIGNTYFDVSSGLLADSGQPSYLDIDPAMGPGNPDLSLATYPFHDWAFKSLDDGYYQISVSAGRGSSALGTIDNGEYGGARLTMTAPQDIDGQKWQVSHLENGYCRLTSKLLGSDVALSVVNDSESPRLAMAPVSDSSDQNWRLDLHLQIGVDEQLLRCDDDPINPIANP